MVPRTVAGHEEASLIRKVNPEYAERAIDVVRMLERQGIVGGLEHLRAVKAGLRGEELPKRTED